MALGSPSPSRRRLWLSRHVLVAQVATSPPAPNCAPAQRAGVRAQRVGGGSHRLGAVREAAVGVGQRRRRVVVRLQTPSQTPIADPGRGGWPSAKKTRKKGL
jgi:hypothetical protein